MTAIRSVTPADAKAAWEAMAKPSSRLVAENLTAQGLDVSHYTVARWKKADWQVGENPVKRNTPEQKIEAAIPALLADMALFDPPPPDRSDGELILDASREAAHAATTLMRLVKGSPAASLEQPEKIAKLLDASSDLIEKAIAGFKQAEHVLGAGAKVINATTNVSRPIDTDPLRASLEAYVAVKRPEPEKT